MPLSNNGTATELDMSVYTCTGLPAEAICLQSHISNAVVLMHVCRPVCGCARYIRIHQSHI